jgi:hypothetical protein
MPFDVYTTAIEPAIQLSDKIEAANDSFGMPAGSNCLEAPSNSFEELPEVSVANRRTGTFEPMMWRGCDKTYAKRPLWCRGDGAETIHETVAVLKI